MGGKAGGGARAGGGAGGAGGRGGNAPTTPSAPRTINAQEAGVSISRRDERRSRLGMGAVEDSIFTFTARNGVSQEYRVRTRERTGGFEININKTEALQKATQEFNSRNNVVLTNLPKVKPLGKTEVSSRGERIFRG